MSNKVLACYLLRLKCCKAFPFGGAETNAAKIMLSRRCIFLVACILGILCVLLTISYLKAQSYNQISLSQSDCIIKTESNTITPLEGSKAFIIAPYYDDRKGQVIRILGIVHHEEVKKLYCYLFCSTAEAMHVIEAKIDVHSDRFGFPYGLADIICEEMPNCRAVHVGLHSTPIADLPRLTKFVIRNREQGELSANFTVCISTVYGNYSNALQFIQTVEMYRLLGAQKVVVYLKDCSQLVENIFDYYIKEGTLEVVPWTIQKHLKPSSRWHVNQDKSSDIGYYGQTSTLNDCIYRNMYKSKFVVLNDVDEIILPFHHLTWNDLMERLQLQHPDSSVFLFESQVFPQTVVTDGGFLGVSSWKDIPGFNLLQHIHKEPKRAYISNHEKMIIDPRAVVQTSVHSVLKAYGRSVYVPPETAIVHHCRFPWQPHLNKTSLIEDKTIWRYNASLITKVTRVINQIVQCSKSYTDLISH